MRQKHTIIWKKRGTIVHTIAFLIQINGGWLTAMDGGSTLASQFIILAKITMKLLTIIFL